MLLASVLACGVLISSPRFKDVVELVQAPLLAHELFFGEPPAPNVVNQPCDLLLAALEGAHKGVGGASKTPLEDAHRQAGSGAVQHSGAIVVMLEVLGRLVVELLFTLWPLRKLITQGGAVALWIQGGTIEADHFLFGPADEVPLPRVGGKIIESVVGRERVRQQQTPQEVVRIVLAHVWCGRQQQQVLGRPRKLPAFILYLSTG